MGLDNVLTTLGPQAFGIGLPLLGKSWANAGTVTAAADGMSVALAGASGQWLAPIAGHLTVATAAAPAPVTLLNLDGNAITGDGILLTLFPQAYARLSALYARVLEPSTTARPGRTRITPTRPVPRYFLFSGTAPAGTKSYVDAGVSLGLAGDMRAFDAGGYPIDPLAVASAFKAIWTAHEPIGVAGPSGSVTVDTIVGAVSGGSVVRLRLVDPAGRPNDGSRINGITAVAAAPGKGLFTLNASGSGSSSALTGTASVKNGTGTTGTFPDEIKRLTQLGFSTTGRLSQSITFPSLPSGTTLARDFFSLWVIDYDQYLVGTWNANWDGTKVAKRPKVRLHEPVDLLTDGNDVLGAATTALTGASTVSIAVGQTIEGNFAAPVATGTGAHWSAFPSSTVTPAAAGAIPANLRANITPTASWFDDGNAATANTDVILTLTGLPDGAWARIYPRVFTDQADELRGDGTGVEVPAGGTVKIRLRDPLKLRKQGLSESAITAAIPVSVELIFDLAVVKRTGESRIFGALQTPVSGTDTTDPTASVTNLFGTAQFRGVCSAGILGLPAPAISLSLSNLLAAAQALAGETQPRDASRLPTMARRELLAAGLASASGGAWRAVLGGGRLARELHSADAKRGTPGGLGGRETQAIGVSTQNGLLAYDIARMAFRRSLNVVERLTNLKESRWSEPTAPTALSASSSPTANAGTMVGAVLQTVALCCETPELHALRPSIDVNSTTRPTSFSDLVDWVGTHLVPQSIPFRQQIIDKLNELKTNPEGNRLFDETEREIMSACFGRRDTQWALKTAIGNARRFIYIESPGIAATALPSSTTADYAADLFAALASRINAAPGLHVMFCSPRQPDFAELYAPFGQNEAVDRRTQILALPTATGPGKQSRVVAFHPVGFPGRPSRLETTVVIVDDIWALVGSSTFRRRGLTFDGGTDAVLADLEIEGGVSLAIRDFRLRLLENRLGIDATGPGASSLPAAASPAIPAATRVRLTDGVDAFHAIRDVLRAGGLGRIMPLWNPGTSTPISPPSLPNPDGEEFSLAQTLAVTTLAANPTAF